MKTVAIETSGHTFSIALGDDGVVTAELFWNAGLRHSETLVPALERLLADAGWALPDVRAVVVSTGPGSFTGIRVGISCARTLAQHLRLPLIGVPTLAVLAAQVSGSRGDDILPMIDALRGEVFVNDASAPGVAIRTIDDVCRAARKKKARTVVVGSGAVVNRALIERELPHALFAPALCHQPRAGTLIVLAAGLKGGAFSRVEPLYVRRSWAEERAPAARRR